MNIRTATDIDHAIQAACDLHDLHAGQTGTRRAPRTPNPDQPADRPPVEFEAEDGDRSAVAHWAAVFDDATEAMLAAPMPDQERNRLVELQDLAFKAMIAEPNKSLADMAAKKARWWFYAEIAGFDDENIAAIKAACEREAELWRAGRAC